MWTLNFKMLHFRYIALNACVPHRICPMVIQFLVFLFVYMLLLLVTLAEEFKRSPPYLQHLCCWIHETKSIRNLLTLTAITINFGVASCDIVSARIDSFLGQIEMLLLTQL